MKKFKGFTLIELVVVIAILAILAAVAIPRFVDLSHKARRATASAELGALRAAANLFYASTATSSGNPHFPSNTTSLLNEMQEGPTQLVPPMAGSFAWTYYGTGANAGRVVSTGGSAAGQDGRWWNIAW